MSNQLFFDDDGTGIRHWLRLAPGVAPGLPRNGVPVSLPTIAGNTALYQAGFCRSASHVETEHLRDVKKLAIVLP